MSEAAELYNRLTGAKVAVLLVDDDANILDTAKDILEEAGYEITTASTGAQAVAQLDQKAFNVVVVDFQLPDATGLELARKVRERNDYTLVILMTGHASLEMAVKAIQEAGADKTWFQECKGPRWIRGGKEELKVTNGAEKNHQLAVAALGNSTGTGIKGINGPVIEIKSFDDLEANKDNIKGKIVFYNYKFNPRFIKTFESYGDAVLYRYMGPVRAARYGATGVILRSMTHSVDNFPHTGSTASGDTLPKIPAMAIGLKDADWLDDQLQKTSVNVFSDSGFLCCRTTS